MGQCCGGGGNQQQQALLRDQIDDHGAPAAKVLILGIGQAGKNTLFKQMRRLTHNISDKDLSEAVAVVHQNVLDIMRTIAEQSRILNDTYEIKLDPDNYDIRDRIANIDTYKQSTISSDILDDWDQLWRDPGIEKTMMHREEFRLQENADWFLQRLDEISHYNYIPDMDDYARARLRLTGVDKLRLELAESSATDSDVHTLTDAVDICVAGGQRHERKRWATLLRDASAIIYVTSIGDYSKTIFEDDKQHVDEDFQVFRELMMYEPLHGIPFVIIPSKRDLCEHRIESYPLSDYVKDSKSYHSDNADGVADYYKSSLQKLISDSTRPVMWLDPMNLLDVSDVDRFLRKFRPWIRDILLRHAPLPRLNAVPSDESIGSS